MLKLLAFVVGALGSSVSRVDLGKVTYWTVSSAEEYKWVARRNWTYSAGIDVRTLPEDVRNFRHVYLDLEGVDTVATVYWNGVPVVATDNMFVRYRVPVVPEQMNDLQIEFGSPIRYAENQYRRHVEDKGYDVKPQCQFAECHANHIRKMQSSFGWDWGPAFPSVGLWKNAYLSWTNEPCVLKDILWSVAIDQGKVKATVTIILDWLDPSAFMVIVDNFQVDVAGVKSLNFSQIPVYKEDPKYNLEFELETDEAH